jgi:imidazolonepropionase-like amidohydrolase
MRFPVSLDVSASWFTTGLIIALTSVSAFRSIPAHAAVAPAAAQTGRPPVAGAPAGVTAFVGVAVIPMNQERVLAEQTVLVQHGRIAAIGPVSQVTVPAQALRIDGRGKYLIPGLADMHVHIGSGKERIAYTHDSAGAERRLFLWLANGLTTVRNVDYREAETRSTGSRTLDPTFALRLRARAAAGELLSPRIYTSGPWGPERYRGTGVIKKSKEITRVASLDSVAVYVAMYKAAGYDFIKTHDEESPELLDSLAAAARRVGLPLIGHIWGSGTHARSSWASAIEPEEAVAWVGSAGFASIEHLLGFNGHLSLDDTARMRTLAEATKRTGAWHSPTRTRSNYSVKDRFLKALHEAGVGLLLGTDAPIVFSGSRRHEWPHGNPAEVHQALWAFVRAGLTPYEALETGTRNIAVFFNTLDETGTIEEGKRADLVLLNGNPLEDIRNTARSAGVMIGGRWLSREDIDRHLATFPADSSGERMYFYWRIVDGLQEFYWHSGSENAVALFGGLALTGAQQASFRQLRTAHEAQWAALVDSLEVGYLDQAGTGRALQLAGRQIGEYRVLLSTEQRGLFDPRARAWAETYERQGYAATIPGVTPTPSP